MMARMRALVLSAPLQLDLADIPLPTPGPHDVVLRIGGVGLCGTDFHIYEGHANYHTDRLGRPIPLPEAPQVLGHEVAGEVVEVGRDVQTVRPGDAVVIDQGRNCMSAERVPLCEYCGTGHSHQCEDYGEHGITGLQGGLAEFLVMPAVNCVRRDGALPPALAAMTEPLACIVHACDAVERATARYRFTAAEPAARVRAVVLLGAGPAGLLFLQYLRRVLRVPAQVIVSEPNPHRRALATRYGADLVLDPAAGHIAEAVLDATGGRRAEYVIDAAGVGSVFRDIPGLLRKQGTVLMYAHGQSGVDLGVLNTLMFREPTLVTPVGASGGFDEDGRPAVYRRALRLLEEGTVDVSAIVTHRYTSLDALPEAFGGPDRRDPCYVKGVYAP
jgi:2-desacetyl-2-hydroxyethyl bacteriochlorophyllide A dehydrogenase